MSKLTEVVLTGGPCSGKSTAKAHIAQKIGDLGIRVFFVPEAATLLFDPGIPDIREIADTNRELFLQIELEIIRLQIALRDRYLASARLFDGPSLVVNDRWIPDGLPYTGQEDFQWALGQVGLSIVAARDCSDAVIYLETAPKRFYNFNNKQRRETWEQAVEIDKQTVEAYFGHPHLIPVDNSTDFGGKMDQVVKALTRALGIPVPLEIERKFLLKSEPDFGYPELQKAVPIDIEQIYLKGGARIRRRSQFGSSTYFYTEKQQLSPLERLEVERRIDPSEYRLLALKADRNKRVIRKIRYCFVWKNLYFELDQFIQPHPLWLLEVELTEQNDYVDLPPFLPGTEEVTGDERFYNANIARI